MKFQRATTIMLFVLAMSFAIRAIMPDRPQEQRIIIIDATPTLPGIAPVFAAERPPLPAPDELPTAAPLLIPTAEPMAVAPPAPPAEPPPAPEPATEPAAAPPLVTSFYPDVELIQAAVEASRDLPILECPCGIVEPQPYATMTTRQQQQSRQRTR